MNMVRKTGFMCAALALCVAVLQIQAGDYTPMNASLPRLPAQTESVTNGATLEVTNGFVILEGSGSANDNTNSVTLSDPLYVGRMLLISVSATSSNLITIADSGNCSLSSAWLGDNNDVIGLISSATNMWVQFTESDN